MPRVDFAQVAARRYDLVVVGSGPAGLALALSTAREGLATLLVERGGARPPSRPDPAYRAVIAPGGPHDPLEQTTCAAFGGTSHWWGGRAVPLDPEDFRPSNAWPLDYSDYEPWIAPAAAFLGVAPHFEAETVPGWASIEGVEARRVERLAPRADLATRHRAALEAASGPDVLLEATATGFEYAEGGRAIEAVRIGEGRVRARMVALCAGGLETTRLLLIEQRRRPELFGGVDGPLGRGYMGHLTGSISEIDFAAPADARAFSYVRDGAPGPARRRFTPAPPEAGQNIAFWTENLPMSDARHGSATLSMKHLALRASWVARLAISEPLRRRVLARGDGGSLWPHVGNMARRPGSAIASAAGFLARRVFTDDRPPDRLELDGKPRFRLAYHAEQAPSADSRVRLSDERDAQGAPRLFIDYRVADRDLEAVTAAHDRLAAALAASGRAALRLCGDRAAQIDAVRAQARDGYHQLGLTRMSKRPGDGVVDRDGRAHGLDNLYIASASVFPTSGQANPTLSIVAFALRLGAFLAGPQAIGAAPASQHGTDVSS